MRSPAIEVYRVATPAASEPRKVAWSSLWLAGAGGLAVGMLALAVLMTRALGFHVFTVESGSMSPTLVRGDLVVSRPESINFARIGDIVVFDEGTQTHLTVVHRMIAYTDLTLNINDTRTGHTTAEHVRFIRTKGDANPGPDGQQVDQSRFIGVVWFKIPRVGSVLIDPMARAVLLLAVVLSGLAWIALELRQLVRRPCQGHP